MKKYNVLITEKISLEVSINAESEEDAENIVRQKFDSGHYEVAMDGSLDSVSFEAEEDVWAK